MPDFSMIFDRLDQWRHLPKYQLERRADIFFSLYIPEVLGWKYGISIHPIIIPEFPIRKGLLPGIYNGNDSTNVDYVAVSEARDTVFFIELKTDMGSRRDEQDLYLKQAAAIGLPALLGGIRQIFTGTSKANQSKYLHLLHDLESQELLRLPLGLDDLVYKGNSTGLTELAKEIAVTCPDMERRIVYIQPQGNSENTISFKEFAEDVRLHDDPSGLIGAVIGRSEKLKCCVKSNAI